jgi:Protein of unknown function (DUF3352)
MTDDQTRASETPAPAGETTPDGGAGSYAPAATAPVSAPKRSNRLRWVLALGVAALAVAVAIGGVTLLGAPSSPEALRYIPGDAAMVAELRMDLPGDQMENLGDLLAHFPGFQDQSTLPLKIDEAMSRLFQMSGQGTDYLTDIKPYLTGPMFAVLRTLDGAESGDLSSGLLVATTNGAVACATAFEGQTLTHETYRELDISTPANGEVACAVDGRFFLVGDPATLKLGLDAKAAANGLDKSAKYTAARAKLGLDRLAAIYIDGKALFTALAKEMPENPLAGQLGDAAPEWMAFGIRAEADALVFDAVLAPPAPNASLPPGMVTLPPAHPIALAQLAPADTLVFLETQGFGVSFHNMMSQVVTLPEMQEPLAMLEQVGGLDGLVGWVEDIGVIVVPDGDLAAGALLLVAKDAASASEKVTAVTTVLALGALGGDVDVSESTIAGVEVTTVHIPDASALLGGAIPGTDVPPISLDFSIAARDKVVYFGVGTGIMDKILGVTAGGSLVDNAAYQRAVARSLANPQSLIYVAAGAGLDLIEKAIPAAELGNWTTDVKPYVDPLEAIAWSVTGDGTQGAFRVTLTVANP